MSENTAEVSAGTASAGTEPTTATAPEVTQTSQGAPETSATQVTQSDVTAAVTGQETPDKVEPVTESAVTDLFKGEQKEGTEGTEGEKPEGEKSEADQPQFPDNYELKGADGQPLADELQKGAAEDLRALGVTDKAQAQKLYDFYQKNVNAVAMEYRKAYETEMEASIKAVNSDPEIGGTHWNDTKKNIGAAMQAFGTPELQAFLSQNSLASCNPELLRFVARVGKAVSNDNLKVSGSAAGGSGRMTAEQVYRARYPNSPEMNFNA